MSRSTAVHAAIGGGADAALGRVREYLRVPGFSASGEGIAASATLTREHLARICDDARVVPTAGHPVVFGTRRSRRPEARTLVVYGLYDLTPTHPHEWRVDPLGATVLPAADLGLDPGLGDVLVSRGAHNHRGPVLAAIMAVEAMLTVEGDVPCHLVFVIEGEEEVGSPSLAGFLEEHRDVFAHVDGAWLPCMAEGTGGVMTVHRGFKGVLWFELFCAGGEWGGTLDGTHLWAGHSAWIDAPLVQIVHAVGSLFDGDHGTAIDDVDRLVLDIDDEDRRDGRALAEALRADPAAEAEMLRTLGVARLRAGKRLDELVERFMFGINLNLQGVAGGHPDPGYYTMLPGAANARLDLRLPPGVAAAEALGLIRAHLDRRGLSSVQIRDVRSYPAARTPGTDPLLTAAATAAAAHGARTSVMPMFNGCCPASLFQALAPAGLPFSFAGLGQGERPHAPHEFIRTDAVRRLMDFTVTYLHAWTRNSSEEP